jgi:asparagine synthase (glutamine-hydrolysing)
MTSADGSVTAAYNGEIYNFRELREELRAHGHEFRSDCDTEVLIEAWRAWNFDAFERFVGMFAFAIWDAPRSRLVLARDRVGIKPLYYHSDEELLLFGSDLRALRLHRGFRPEIDRGALGRYLQNGYVTGPETIYAGTRRLMPGECLVWHEGRISTRTWWRISDAEEAPPARSVEEAVDGLEQRLAVAVEERLIADVPLGAFLSGGIDSSTVVALMQERASGPVRTFSIGFRDSEYDEAPHARAVAAHLRTDHTELYVDRAQAVAVAHELPELYDEPFGDASAIPTVLLSRLTRRHVTVSISGDGGDELLGGYRQYARLRRMLSLLRIPHALRAPLAAAAPLVPQRSVQRGLRHLRAANALDLAERILSYYEAADLQATCGNAAAQPRTTFREAFRSAPTADPVRCAMYADARTYLPDDILTKVDHPRPPRGALRALPAAGARLVRRAHEGAAARDRLPPHPAPAARAAEARVRHPDPLASAARAGGVEGAVPRAPAPGGGGPARSGRRGAPPGPNAALRCGGDGAAVAPDLLPALVRTKPPGRTGRLGVTLRGCC